MIFKNYYKLLGLEKNIKSTQSEIKNAYREQAKKYHPDVNVNNKAAEERFKDINEGYRILSNPSERKKYDRAWYNYVGKKMSKEASSGKEIRMNDIMGIFFGNNTSAKNKNEDKPLKGENIETEIDISIKEAFDGTEKKISIASETGKNKIITVEIPSGIKNGGLIRIQGEGKKGKNGGSNGDFILKINIKDNTYFRIIDQDIYVDLLITPWDAALGTKMTVGGIDGEISLLIPKGTQNGDKISIPNKGYYIDKNKRGNLIINTKIAIPKNLTDEEKDLFAKLRSISSFKPNEEVNII